MGRRPSLDRLTTLNNCPANLQNLSPLRLYGGLDKLDCPYLKMALPPPPPVWELWSVETKRVQTEEKFQFNKPHAEDSKVLQMR